MSTSTADSISRFDPNEIDGWEGARLLVASAGYELEDFDFTKITMKERDEIQHIYDLVFRNDIGLVFDPKLDSDFQRPLKYYSPSVRGAYVVVRERAAVNTATAAPSDEQPPQGRIVGVCALRDMSCADLRNTAEVKRMFFLPECRGKRLAVAVVARVLAHARRFDYDHVVLDTKKKLAAANKVYENYGWRDCEDYNGNPRADRWMRLTLQRSPPPSKL